jgi:FtsH-binding integral membrane protein
MPFNPSCENYFGKIFAHLGAALAVSALSAEYSDVGSALIKTDSILIQFVLNLVILIGLLFAVIKTKPGTLYKYTAFIALAYWIGQVSKPYWEKLQARGDLTKVLLLTTGVFAGMAAIGFYDRQNLLGFGPYLFAGLGGLILAELLVYALGTEEERKATFKGFRILGVALFAAYTAYDVQVIKAMKSACGLKRSKAIPDYPVESLNLYLDFVNLFTRMGRSDE